MEINNLKLYVKEFIKKIPSVLKETLSLPYAKLYVLLSVIMVSFFILITFPYEIIIRNQLQKLESSLGKELSVGNIELSLFNNSNIDSLKLILDNGTEIGCKDIDIDVSLNPYTTIIRDTLKGNIIIKNLKYSQKKSTFNCTLKSNFNLKFNTLTGFPSKGHLVLQLQNVHCDGLTIKEFDIPPVRFTSIKTNAKISGKKINIQNITLSGSDIKGSIKGSITLSKFIKNSRLNLDIKINSSSLLLENYKLLLNDMIGPDNNLKIAIKGTVAKPKIDLSNKDRIR